jgi:predicted nucleic acid-binding protein
VAGELFVDTSAWYPVVVARHPGHQALAQLLSDRVRAGQRLVTTNLIVAETHALLLHRVHRQAALTFARTVREAPNLVVTSTPELEGAAITRWLERFDDQDFTLTDAVSFQVMATRRITEALALDRHFTIAGFRIAPT